MANVKRCFFAWILSSSATATWYDWVYQMGSAENELGRCVRSDSAGNVLVLGDTLGNFSGASASAGGKDLILVKVSGTGAYQWSVQRGTATDDYGMALEVDTSGNSYLAGYTNGGLDGQSNAGSWDGYVMKVDSAGSWQWTTQRGGTSDDRFNALALDSSANLVSRMYFGNCCS